MEWYKEVVQEHEGRPHLRIVRHYGRENSRWYGIREEEYFTLEYEHSCYWEEWKEYPTEIRAEEAMDEWIAEVEAEEADEGE